MEDFARFSKKHIWHWVSQPEDHDPEEGAWWYPICSRDWASVISEDSEEAERLEQETPPEPFCKKCHRKWRQWKKEDKLRKELEAPLKLKTRWQKTVDNMMLRIPGQEARAYAEYLTRYVEFATARLISLGEDYPEEDDHLDALDQPWFNMGDEHRDLINKTESTTLTVPHDKKPPVTPFLVIKAIRGLVQDMEREADFLGSKMALLNASTSYVLGRLHTLFQLGAVLRRLEEGIKDDERFS